MPQSPINPAAITFWLTRCAAPVALDDSVAVPLAVLEAVLVAAVPVTEAPVEASVVVPEAELELAVVVALATFERRSRPAVIVTVTRLSEMSLMIADVTPGSFALGPAIVSTQLAVWEASWQSRSTVLGCSVSQTKAFLGSEKISSSHSQFAALCEMNSKCRRSLSESHSRPKAAVNIVRSRSTSDKILG